MESGVIAAPGYAGEGVAPRAKLTLKMVFVRGALRLFMVLYCGLLRILIAVAPSKRSLDESGFDVLVTGTFYSDNWLATHLRPLALSSKCRRVIMVASSPVPPMEKVEAIYPPAWLIRLLGSVPARLFMFSYSALKIRPDFIAGFHLLLNGLLADLLAKFTGARSIYFCGGGPREVAGGGYATENRLFSRLGAPDPGIEARLLRVVNSFDMVITMGSSAVDYFCARGAASADYHVIPGGFDGNKFYPADASPMYDLILVGRISHVKRVDIFLDAVKHASGIKPDLLAVIVGDGPLKHDMEEYAKAIGISATVKFVGWSDDVAKWLRGSKIFVLTSESEGVSQAMIQAMLCGLPVVVSDVGDLRDLARPGHNGYLVRRLDPWEFAKHFVDLLADGVKLKMFSAAALNTARKYEMKNTSGKWDSILQAIYDKQGSKYRDATLKS